MDGEFGLFVDLVEPDGLLKLALGADGAGVSLLVDPLDGEGVGAREAAYLAHLALQVVVPDRVVDVRDEDLAEIQQNLKCKFWKIAETIFDTS